MQCVSDQVSQHGSIWCPCSAHWWPRWRESGVCADSLWLYWQWCWGSSFQEGWDPDYPGQARGAVVERKEQGGPHWNDPCPLRRKDSQAIASCCDSWPWLTQLEQLRHPRACTRLCSATDTIAPAPRHTRRCHQPASFHAEWARHGQSHSETSSLCIWQDCLSTRGMCFTLSFYVIRCDHFQIRTILCKNLWVVVGL